MLRSQLLHPEILSALGGAGHGSRVVIADGNFPYGTGAAASARRVYLNLRPGLVTVTEVLETLVAAIPIESAMAMVPAEGPVPPIHAEMRAILPKGTDFQTRGRFEFYDEARSQDTALVIATGEQRIYACIILVIGVVPPK